MRQKFLETAVRISKGTRAKLRTFCNKNNLQQGHYADAAILAAINGKNHVNLAAIPKKETE